MEMIRKILEQIPIPEKGVNIELDIELIRHPEKDYETGKLTLEGKRKFILKLVRTELENLKRGFDVYEIYLSPHKRPQQLRKITLNYLKNRRLSHILRNEKKLLGGLENLDPASITKTLSSLEKSSPKQTINNETGTSEPTSKESEENINKILIQHFFDVSFIDSKISGKTIASELENIIKKLRKRIPNLKTNSKLKIFLIGHSGVIEHFIKKIYLDNHPEEEAKKISTNKIGGLLEYLAGPKIILKSDDKGKISGRFYFKELTANF